MNNGLRVGHYIVMVVTLFNSLLEISAICRSCHVFFLLDWQVIFPALDIRVKNVARTYSLEHEGESVLFDQLSALLDPNMQNEESCRRELASCTGALETSINQHMSKEEEQVKITFYMFVSFMLYLRSASYRIPDM